MKVLNLCVVDYGGAGTAAMRIHTNLRRVGVDSRMLVLYQHSDDIWVKSLAKSKYLFQIKRLFHKMLLKFYSVSDYYFQRQNLSPNLSVKILRENVDFEPDVIVAHVLSHFLSPQDVLKIHNMTNAPIIWNLLDMAAFTGGCHYSWSCRRYEENCGNCPALRLRGYEDLSRKIWQEKFDVMSNMNMAVIAGSTLLHNQAKRSSLFRYSQINTILLPVDPDIFHPSDRSEAKKKLGLTENKKTLFFGAQALKNRRKGMDYMLNALSSLSDNPLVDNDSIEVVTAGNISDLSYLEKMNFSHKHLGYIREELRLALAYQAADVFVCPSIEDSGPMMINESMMSGTPVVAFDMGVASDLIIPLVTGYIAELMNVDDLANGIVSILSLNENESTEMSNRCREQAISSCDPRNQTEKMIKFFTSVTTNDPMNFRTS